MRLCLYLIVAILVIFPPATPAAKNESSHEIMKGVLSSFSLPLGDLLKKEHPSEWKNLFEGFSGGFGFNCPLKENPPGDTPGSGPHGEPATNMTVTASIKYNPLSYWYVNTTFYKYLRSDYQASWDPDFSYGFGYDDWHPYTLSLTYANYGGNRLNPDKKKAKSLQRSGRELFRWDGNS